MTQHYYQSKGTAKRLLEKMEKSKQLNERLNRLNIDLRTATGEDREDLRQAMDAAKRELWALQKTVV